MSTPQIDKEGFLKNLNDWNESLAHALAEAEGIELSEDHWQIIFLARNYQQQFDKSPEMRPFIKYIKRELDEKKASSLYLLSLFPDSPAKLISKIAGLPKPDNCL